MRYANISTTQQSNYNSMSIQVILVLVIIVIATPLNVVLKIFEEMIMREVSHHLGHDLQIFIFVRSFNSTVLHQIHDHITLIVEVG